MLRKIFFAVFAIGFACAGATIYTPQSVKNPRLSNARGCISDTENILSADEFSAIENACLQALDTSGVEMAVVVVDSIAPDDLFDFGMQLFSLWGIGEKGKDNGILLLMSVGQRDVRIINGNGMEGIMTDALSGVILDKAIEKMRTVGDDKFGVLLTEAATLISSAVCSEAARAELLTLQGEKEIDYSFLLPFVLFLTFIIILTILSQPKCPNCKKRKVRLEKSNLISAATYTSSGSKHNFYCCKNCGFKFDKIVTIPRLSRGGSYSGGRSFGGSRGGSFGGGRSSGGGAGRRF